MMTRRWNDVAIVVLALTAVVAMGVAVVAAMQTGSGDSPAPVVRDGDCDGDAQGSDAGAVG